MVSYDIVTLPKRGLRGALPSNSCCWAFRVHNPVAHCDPMATLSA
jgi:hypothetical protein